MKAGALLWLVAALGAGSAITQDPPRFGADVEAVYLDVFVSHGRDVVTGLGAADFEVLDDGRRQEVRLVAAEEAPPLHAILVLDTSGSVEGDVLTALKAASRRFLEDLPNDSRASLITFSHTVRLAAGPAAPSQLLAPLSQASAGGGTALNDALFSAVMLSRSTGLRSLIVAFTDGVDTASWLDASNLRAATRESEATVYVVGIDPGRGARGEASPWRHKSAQSTPPASGGFDVRDTQGVTSRRLGPGDFENVGETRQAKSLRDLTEETGGRVLLSTSADGLRDAFGRIVSERRSRYLLSFSPQGVTHGGWHELTVRLTSRSGQVRTRRGYFQRKPGGEQDR